MRFLERLKGEFFHSAFGITFMLIGVLIQVIAAYINNDSALSLVSGIAGVISVVLCSQKKFSFYIFAWIQMITYAFLAFEQRLYGELTEYVFYAITTVYGMFIWFKHYNLRTSEVIPKALSLNNSLYVFLLNAACIWIVYDILKATNDTQPILDSISTVPAFTAQILMVFRFKEQWLYWLIIDIASIIMWINADNWCMVMQFVFWTANCVYGYYLWRKQ